MSSMLLGNKHWIFNGACFFFFSSSFFCSSSRLLLLCILVNLCSADEQFPDQKDIFLLLFSCIFPPSSSPSSSFSFFFFLLFFLQRCEMCNSANPYMAPTVAGSRSYGNGWKSDHQSSSLGDTSGINSVTWRTDDRSDDENDDDRRRGGRRSSDGWGDSERRDRSNSPRGRDRSMGWERRNSSRNLASEFDSSSAGGGRGGRSSQGSLSDSYRIPRSSGPSNWSSHGSSSRRDSFHDRNRTQSGSRTLSGGSGSSRSRSRSSRSSSGGGGGLSATWAGNRGR